MRKGVPGPETVASHSWGVAWLVLALAPPELDRGRALAYATVHDVAEVRVGDLTPADRVPAEEKSRRERTAMAAMDSELGSPRLLSLWDRYEAQADREARFVRELDRLDMALQALAYHEAGSPGMEEFLDSADAAIRDPTLRPWIDSIRLRMRSGAVR
ncbi:MAG: HD domain-containing protein [Deltaproteobacteria bacterium]|nr:HD domain-containing protein [Deltaproteobacteria bacterium]